MEAAKHPSHRRRARIAGRRPDGPAFRLRSHHHAPELEHLEHAAAEAEPRLVVHHRAAVLEPDRQRDRNRQQQPQRQQHRQREGDQRQVERAPVALAPPHRRRPPPAGARRTRRQRQTRLPRRKRPSRPSVPETPPVTRGFPAGAPSSRAALPGAHHGRGSRPATTERGPRQATRRAVRACIVRRRGDSSGGLEPGPVRAARTGRTASGPGKMSGGAAS